MSERNPDSGQGMTKMARGTPPPHDSDDWYYCDGCGCSFHRDALDRTHKPIAGRERCVVCFKPWAKFPVGLEPRRARG